MMRASRLLRPTLAAVAAISLATASRALAEGGAAAPAAAAAGGLRFLRVYAPADRVQDWPRGNVKYVPMDAAEFERLVGLAAQPPSEKTAAAAITGAEYTARLADDQLVDGEATLEVLLAAAGGAVLSLEPCGLAMRNPRWVQPDGRSQPALLGLSQNGRIELAAPESGRLRFDWSLRGRREPTGVVRLDVRLPACARNVLALDLPGQLTPVPDGGVVSPPQGADSQGRKRWVVELGGRQRVGLRLVPSDIPEPYRQLALVRQATQYDFTLYGVEVTARLQLDVHNEPLSQVALRLDPELQLVGAKFGESDAAWSCEPLAESGGTRVAVRLPSPAQGTGRLLRLSARAPLHVGSAWQLPRIRPEALSWQEGSATLLVPAPLAVEELTPLGCRQSSRGPLPAPRMGESLEFQSFGPEAGVRVVLGQTDPPLAADCGTTVELSEREMAGRVRASFRAGGGERFVLEAEVGRRWLIDSVESHPPAAVEDWSMETAPNGPGKLAIRLARPVTAARPLQLVVSGRRLQSPVGRPLRAEDVVPLRFQAAPGGKRLVAVRAAGPSYELAVTGAEGLKRIDPQGLERADLELFERPPDGFLFHDDAGADSLQFALEPRKPGYAATSRLEAVVAGESLTERCRLACVPQGTRVDRVVVQFSHPRAEPVQWSMGAEKDRRWTARRLAEAEQAAAGVPSEAEAWEITVRPSRSGPFEIHGERTSRLSGETPLALVGLPDASSQQGTLVVRSADPGAVTLVNHRLTPIPGEAERPELAASPPLGTFRYDPLRDAAPRRQPAASVRADGGRAAGPLTWAWSLRLTSQYEADGTGHHAAAYWLQNQGGREWRLRLPEGTSAEDVEGVSIDGVRGAWRAVPGDDEAGPSIAVGLASGRKFTSVSLRFRTAGGPLSSMGALAPSLPAAELPVLSRHWTVWLPPGHEATCPRGACVRDARPALTASQRLFGALGRRPDEPPFDPLAGEDWRGLVQSSPGRESSRRAAEHILQTIADAAGANGSPPGAGVQWGATLAHESFEKLGYVVLADQDGICEAGVGPRTRVAASRETEPTARGADALRQAGLAVLVSDRAALVTSGLRAAVHRPLLDDLGYGVVWRAPPGPLAEQMAEAAQSQADPAFVPVAVWRETAPNAAVPWARDPADPGPEDTPGWTAYRMEIPDGAEVRLELLQRGRAQSLYWATMLAVAALGCWLARRRPAVLVAAAGVASAVALLVPEDCVMVFSGAVLGTLAALGWSLAAGRRARRKGVRGAAGVESGRAPSTIAHVAGTAGLVAVVLLAARYATGQGTQPPAAPPAAEPPYRVFIAIDAKEQPTGDRYQVPEPLYRELRRREQSLGQEPRGWLLRSATYRGELAWDAAPGRLVLARMTAVLDVEMLGTDTRLVVPFGREGVNLAPGGVMLDGRPIEPEWVEGGAALAFNLPEAARALRLELAFRPKTNSAGPLSGFDLAVPRVPGSRLELTAPADAPPIDVTSAQGAVTVVQETSRRIAADLGPAAVISARWPEGSGWTAAGRNVEVEELLWLRLQPGTAVLDARIKLKVLEGRVQQVRLAADPRLRLLPMEGPGAPAARSYATPEQSQIIELQFPQPIADQATIEARFLLSGVSGVGNVRLPKLETLDVRPARRWLAVSVDPSLECVDPAPERPQAVAVPDFLSAWGKSESQPRFADSLGPGDAGWSLVTRPRDPKTAAEQTIALGFGEKWIAVRYDARLTTTGGYSFQHRLIAPADLEVESVSVMEGGVERAARWARGPDAKWTVFLNAPVAGKHDLSLRGRLPAVPRGRRTLPTVQLEGVDSGTAAIELFRRPEVVVRMAKSAGLVELDSPTIDESKAAMGRLVHRFAVDGGQKPEAEVTVAGNRPEIEATQITSLRAEGDSWEAVVDLSITVRKGLADDLRLDVPATWAGPYKSSPPVPLGLAELSEGGRRQLVIRPVAAIEGTFRIRISGPLTAAIGQPAMVPDIGLRGVDSVERFLVLPTQRQLQPIAWDTRGLERSELPKDFVAPPVGPEAFVAYKVTERDFRANLRTLDEEGDAPQVQLADIRLAWQDDGAHFGTATFYVLPAGEVACPLELPPGCRLVQASVEGSPTEPIAGSGEGKLLLPLASESLPQLVEVVFAGRESEAGAGGLRQFSAPRLGDWPVKATLWAVCPPPDYVLAEPEGVGRVSGLRQETYRLRTLAALIESAVGAHAGPREDLARWYSAWAVRLEASRAEVRRGMALPPQSDFHRTVRAEYQSMDLKQAQIADSLGLSEARAAAASRLQPDDAAQLWLHTLNRPEAISRSVVHGAAESFALRYSPEGGSMVGRRWVQAVVLLALTLAALAILHRRATGTLLARWPHALGVAAGLAWWLWLSPSVLGWVLVLWSLAASFKTAWRPRRPEVGRFLAVGPAER